MSPKSVPIGLRDVKGTLPERTPVPDDVARQFERDIAARGEGVAGQPRVTSQAHELTTSQAQSVTSSRAHELTESQAHEPKASRAREPTKPRAQSVTKSRRHETTSSRDHELTQEGTMRNPRTRKDGVETRATTVHFPIELAARVNEIRARSGHRFSELVVEAVEAWVADREGARAG